MKVGVMAVKCPEVGKFQGHQKGDLKNIYGLLSLDYESESV